MKKIITAVCVVLGFVSNAFGADSTVTALTAAGTLTGSELVYCVQSAADRKCTTSQIGNLSLLVNPTNFGTFFGYQAGQSVLSTDTKDSAFGYQALSAASGSGADSSNSAFGYRSLLLLTTGTSNTGVGDGTLSALTTQTGNVGIGTHAGLQATGNGIVAIGNLSMQNASTGDNVVAVGINSLKVNQANVNVGIGSSALIANTTGTPNIGIGDRPLLSNISGAHNIAIGQVAGANITTQSNNLFIGSSAGQSNTGSGSIMIGFNAGKNETGSNKLYIDNTATATPLIGGDLSGRTVTFDAGLQVGTNALTTTKGAVGIAKIAASGSAPGAGGAKLELVCGTNAGTAKLVISAGTSATPATILDNIGTGVTGC